MDKWFLLNSESQKVGYVIFRAISSCLRKNMALSYNKALIQSASPPRGISQEVSDFQDLWDGMYITQGLMVCISLKDQYEIITN